MKAVYLESYTDEKSLTITGDSFFHLKNVTRIKVNEKILILNGKGLKAYSTVANIDKRELTLKIQEISIDDNTITPVLALCTPKKENFEESIRNAIQLGIREIQPLKSDFSQWSYKHSPRLDKIIESALIQSNNPFWPIIRDEIEFNDFLDNNKNVMHVFSSQSPSKNNDLKMENCGSYLVGPEGGFSGREIKNIEAMISGKVIIHHVESPIFTTVNAVSFCYGYLMGKCI